MAKNRVSDRDSTKKENVMNEVVVSKGPSVVASGIRVQAGRLDPRFLCRVVLLACAGVIASSSALMAQAGRLDPTFGNGGEVITNVPGASSAIANAVALQSDGKIVVAGGFGAGQDIGLVRYNTNGSLDARFGTGGMALANIPNGILSVAIGVGVQTGGKIVAGGTIYTLSGSKAFIGFGVVRFNPNGSMDTSFGTGGLVTTLPFNASRCGGGAFTLQPDQKILLAGGCSISSGGSSTSFSAIARYDANGSLDSTFGTGGVAVLAEAPSAIALQSDGKIVVAGGGIVSRYNSNGSVDSSFGIFGSVGAVGSVAGAAVQGDGKIVVAGTFSDQLSVIPDGDFALVRYNSDGTVDETFGTHGGALADFFTGTTSAAAFALAIESNGDIVAAGKATQGSNPSEFAVARFTSLGTLDSTFGAGGVVTTSFGQTDSVAALAVQTDGKIVAAGNSLNVATGNDAFAVARYTAQ